jgi:selenocysteine lyase/cysteine desulfurase
MTYLDSAGAGPPPQTVYDSMQSFLNQWRDNGERWDEWLVEIVKARESFAKLVGAGLEEVACVPNVTSALAAVASSMESGVRRNVVVSELNFPTNVYIWHSMRQRGLISEVRVLKPHNGYVPASDWEKSIDDNTLAVSVDYVSWINGCRENVSEVTKIAHEHGAMMLVDAFHAAGVIPVSVRSLDVDVLTCGTYKWLMGPHGAAFLYVKRSILDELNPSIIGWHGISDSVIARASSNQDVFGKPFDLTTVDPAKDATRFEWGTWSVISVLGSKSAIEFALKYPVEEREPLVERLTSRLLEGLTAKARKITSPLDESRRSGIVTFEVPKAAEVARTLQSRKVIVAPRVDTLRVSPHFFNTEGEIDTFLKMVDST